MGFSGEDPTATAEGMTASGLFFPATKVGGGGQPPWVMTGPPAPPKILS